MNRGVRVVLIKLQARVAQLVEQLICNQLVGGSSPFSGSRNFMFRMGRFQSGQMGRTVNPLSFDFSGSNPLLPTTFMYYARLGSHSQKKSVRLYTVSAIIIRVTVLLRPVGN